MEIEVRQTLMGSELRDAILEKYGSREAVEAAARAPGGVVAWDDLVTLKEFDEKPSRLELEYQTTTLSSVTADELRRLTPRRLDLLRAIYELDRPMNVRRLAKAVGRDKKNVSDDLRLLDGLGLIDIVRGGREARAVPKATEIRIILRRPEEVRGSTQSQGAPPARPRAAKPRRSADKKPRHAPVKGRPRPSR